MGEGQDQNTGQAAAPLPAAVVPPEEQLAQANKAPTEAEMAVTPPPIPDDATLDSMSDRDLYPLAQAYQLPSESRDQDLTLLKKRRDGVQLQSVEHPNTPVSDEDYDPTNPREFDPTVVLLHLERDGVVVEGFINPFTGAGTRDLLAKLQDELVKARAREDGAAPAHVQVGEAPDPNALKRQRAAAAGHVIDPKTGRCDRCSNAEWWCLDGNPCDPRADTIPSLAEEMTHGEADSPGA
jgi:hypothetical protein